MISYKYNKLEIDYNLLKIEEELVIDSLNKENLKYKSCIIQLKDSLNFIENKIINNSQKIDSIKKDEFIISSSFSESSILLKENLLCTDL